MRGRKELIEPCPELSLQRQCELIGISRSGFYYEPVPESPENLALMRRLDELYLEHPVYGSRRLTAVLRREGRQLNRKRVARLLGLMGLEVAYPKADTLTRHALAIDSTNAEAQSVAGFVTIVSWANWR